MSHCEVQGHSTVICAKTAEPIETQFGLWTRMGPRNHVLDGSRSPMGRGNFKGKGHVFGFYKTRHILLSDSVNCTVLRAVVLTQYRRVTDGQADRRNCRS